MSESGGGRERTDESLRAERGKTDSELERRIASVDRSADQVVRKARRTADRVLQTARDVADGAGEQPNPAEGRSRADGVVADQRSIADEDLRREREERKRALANLLRLEREETDQHLLTERGVSDEALNTRDIFLAMVSHDLRTFLGGIAMAAELLERDAHDAGDRQAAILSRANTIQRLTARMNRLIGDLVDVASIEAGKLLVTPAAGDLLALIRESAELFQPMAAARAIELVAQADGPALEASFDRERILQVLSNLLGNALKFSPRGSRVSIRAGCARGEVRVTVSDNGPGIPAANLEAIFGKFWQAGGSDRRGLGLGLYISKCILEAHGGRIWAESAPAGATLVFALPAIRAEPVAARS